MKNVKEHKWIYLHDIFILISILFYGQKYIFWMIFFICIVGLPIDECWLRPLGIHYNDQLTKLTYVSGRCKSP